MVKILTGYDTENVKYEIDAYKGKYAKNPYDPKTREGGDYTIRLIDRSRGWVENWMLLNIRSDAEAKEVERLIRKHGADEVIRGEAPKPSVGLVTMKKPPTALKVQFINRVFIERPPPSPVTIIEGEGEGFRIAPPETVRAPEVKVPPPKPPREKMGLGKEEKRRLKLHAESTLEGVGVEVTPEIKREIDLEIYRLEDRFKGKERSGAFNEAREELLKWIEELYFKGK